MQERPRARRGNTHDPWPCCGEPPESDFGRPKEGICLECRELIEAGKEAIARQQKAGAGTYGWCERAHWWPRYYGDYLFDDHETGEKLSDAMYEVVQAVTERSLRTEYRQYGNMFLDCQKTHVGYQGMSSRVTANPTVRAKLNELDKQIRAALTSTYNEGKARGQNVILGLASGQMSLRDFEKHLNDRKDR